MKDDSLILALDAGTSLIKAVAFNCDGEQLAITTVPNRIHGTVGGGWEQDMEWTWEAAADALRLMSDQLPRLARRTAALAVTGQGDGTWLMNAKGAPVAMAWLWLDGRSGSLVEAWRQSPTGQAIFAITGTGLNASHQSGQLKWLQQNRPEILAESAHAFHCKDWLYYKFCGEIATDLAEGQFTFGNYRTRQYDPAVLTLLGLEDCARLLPPMVDGTAHHGHLTAAAAQRCGLLAGTPVVLAPVDILCSALGSGVMGSGVMGSGVMGSGILDHKSEIGCTILGSTGIHMRLYRDLAAIAPRHQTGYTMPFCQPGIWARMISNIAASLNVSWFVDGARQLMECCGVTPPDDRHLLIHLNHRAEQTSPGEALFHPYILDCGERGPFVEPLARAQFLGFSQQLTLPGLLRVVYEGLAFAARDCYEHLSGDADVAGRDRLPREIRVSGGMANNPLVRKIFAATLETPVRLSQREEAGAAGAAMIAAVCLRHHRTLTDASPAWVDRFLLEPEAPDASLAAIYRPLFPLYRKGYENMRGLWRDLDQLRQRAYADAVVHG